MHDEFVKDFKIIEKNEDEKNLELLESIKYVKNALNNMYNNLQFVQGDLVDYYTYQIKAQEAKYNYLIKKAKELNIEK